MYDVCPPGNDIYFKIIDKSQKIIDINHEKLPSSGFGFNFDFSFGILRTGEDF